LDVASTVRSQRCPRKDPAPAVAAAACRALGQLKSSSSSAAAGAELLQDASPMVKASKGSRGLEDPSRIQKRGITNRAGGLRRRLKEQGT
jgi:hypothetical protein